MPPCGSFSCARSLDQGADGISCGDRIAWLRTASGGSLSEEAACARVSTLEFPQVCGACALPAAPARLRVQLFAPVFSPATYQRMPHFPLFAAAWIGSATPDVDLQLVLAGDLGPPPWHLIPIESSQSIEHVHCTLSDAIERLGKLMGRNLSSVVQPRFFQQALKPLLLVLFPEFMDHGAHLIGHTDLDILYGSRLSNLLAEMHVRRYDGIQLAHQPDYYAWGPLQVWSANAWRREVKPAVQFFLRRPWAAVPGNLYSWDEWSDGRFGGAGLNESMSGVLAPVVAAGRLRMWRHPFGFHGGHCRQ